MSTNFNEIKSIVINNPLYRTSKIGFEEIRQTMENVENILVDIKTDNKTIKRVYFTSNEFLQNAFRHGIQETEIDFCINKVDDNFFIFSENLIYSDKKNKLKERLDDTIFIAKKSKEELKELYKKQIREGRLGTTSSGLGFIDIMRKSANNIHYNFENVDNDLVRFSIIAIIDVKN